MGLIEKKEKLLSIIDELEEELKDENLYVGFNGHGHLKYIQATREGLLKMGSFFIKSAFSDSQYIDILSEEKQLDWVDPDSEEPIDYIEIISDIKKLLEKRKTKRNL